MTDTGAVIGGGCALWPAGRIVIDEVEEGVVGCSAPIRSPSGAAVAALGITAPKFRFEDSLIDAARTVRRLANQISNNLGSAAGKRSSLQNL